MTPAWTVAFVVLSALTLLLALIVLGLFRRFTAALEAVERGGSNRFEPRVGLSPSRTAPPLPILTPPATQATTVQDVLGGQAGVLLLVSSDCEACHGLIQEAQDGAWRSRRPLVVVWTSDAVGVPERLPTNVVAAIDATGSLNHLLQSDVYPNAFVLDGHGRVLDRLIPPNLAALEASEQRFNETANSPVF